MGFSRIARSSKSGPCALRGCSPRRHPAPEVSGSLGMAQACTEWGGLIYGKSCFTRRCLSPHTSHLSHHSDDRLCRQHKVWIRLRSPTQHARPPHRRPLSSPPRRMARPTDLRVRQPQTVLATSLGHSGPSAAMSPRTSSAASPKFTRWQQAAFTASQRSHIETLLQGHNR